MTTTIALQGVSKSFGKTHVLHELDLSVERGTVFALLGPNGAGKTTIINILSTLVAPDAGRASVEGFDVVASLIRPADAARRALPVVEVTEQEAVDLGHGKRVEAGALPAGASDAAAGAHRRAAIAAIAPGDRLVAIVERRGSQLKVVTGFPPEESDA